MPRGFVYQIIIFSTWGDSYYVGLNGIQLYDNYGKEIKLTADSTFSLRSVSAKLCERFNDKFIFASLKEKKKLKK